MKIDNDYDIEIKKLKSLVIEQYRILTNYKILDNACHLNDLYNNRCLK